MVIYANCLIGIHYIIQITFSEMCIILSVDQLRCVVSCQIVLKHSKLWMDCKSLHCKSIKVSAYLYCCDFIIYNCLLSFIKYATHVSQDKLNERF